MCNNLSGKSRTCGPTPPVLWWMVTGAPVVVSPPVEEPDRPPGPVPAPPARDPWIDDDPSSSSPSSASAPPRTSLSIASTLATTAPTASTWIDDDDPSSASPSSASAPPADRPRDRRLVVTGSTVEVEVAPPTRKPWRAVVASWSIPWRERWGRRANDLAEAGVLFPEDEVRAFDQVRVERETFDEPPPAEVVEVRGSPGRRFLTVALTPRALPLTS
jgi:hypothetical protein